MTSKLALMQRFMSMWKVKVRKGQNGSLELGCRSIPRSPAQQPPITNPKNLRTLTPRLEVRTRYSYIIQDHGRSIHQQEHLSAPSNPSERWALKSPVLKMKSEVKLFISSVHLENKLLLISIDFTLKTSNPMALNKMVLSFVFQQKKNRNCGWLEWHVNQGKPHLGGSCGIPNPAGSNGPSLSPHSCTNLRREASWGRYKKAP